MSDFPASAPAILVVDDDSLVLPLVTTVLRRRGFSVLSASSGRKAIDLFRQHRGSISLALLDVCMPGLSGPETLEELRRIDPKIRACFMSGHTGEYHGNDLRNAGMAAFFEKPFSIGRLAEELWELAQEATCNEGSTA